MSITIGDLLDLDVVRNILTVSRADLPDSTIQGYGLEDDLGVVLDKFIPDWEDLDELVDAKFVRKIKIYVKYKAASLVAVTAPVFILKKMTDGNNEGQRSDKDGFLWLKDDLNARAQEALDDILDELGVITSSTFTLTSVVTPARDVITEPR